MTDCLFRRGLGSVRAVWLLFTLVVVLCTSNVLGSAGSAPAGSPSSNLLAAPLAYQETDFNVTSWSLTIRTQSTAFAREPAAVAGKTIRGVLDFGDGASNGIPFLWQRDARKLFLDLNRNRDLTDDPSGVCLSRAESSVAYQMFTNAHLAFTTAAGRCPVLADVNLYDYSSGPLGGIAEVRSLWQGRMTLNGRDWQVGLVPSDLNQTALFENCQLLLRPWEQRILPFTTSDGSLATVSLTKNLFLDGHAYQLTSETRSERGEVRPVLRFAGQTAALGEVKVTGKFIQRLVLSGAPYLVVLDQPAGAVKVPVGGYGQPGILLEQGGARARYNSSQPFSVAGISVNDRTPAILDAGGPLTNSVTVTRQGQDLRLDYQLIGAGGATYRLVNQDSSRPPTFAIFKGERKIGAGNFEFG